MSIPNATVEPANERDTSSREGRLADSSVPELLARAYRVSFSGSLLLEPVDAAPSTVIFGGGAVVRASGPWSSPDLEWDVLGRLLPPDTLDFARQHAEQYGVTPLDAVERLVLLPPESLVSARQSLTVRGVEELCGLEGDVRYAFVAPSEAEAVPAGIAVEPLGLLATCFLVPSQRERAARSVLPFEYAALTADATRSRSTLPKLTGSVRAVLESLARAPGSMQALRERNLVPNPELVAAVCALWITREIAAQRPETPSVRPTAAPPPRVSVPPRQSIPPFAQAASSMPPPRKHSGFVTAQRSEAERSAKEYAMELKVEEAWMRAEADPARAHEISNIVNRAISVFPKNPRLHYYLARLHIQAHRMPEAVKELERVLELDPSDTEAESELARVRARFGNGS